MVVVKGGLVETEAVRVIMVREEVVMGKKTAQKDPLVTEDSRARVKRSAACGRAHGHRDPRRPLYALVLFPNRGGPGAMAAPSLPHRYPWPSPDDLLLVGGGRLGKG